MMQLLLDRYIYVLVLVLLAIGLYGVLVKGDLVKKVIGLTIFSTAIYLFFIEGSVQDGGTAPVLQPDPQNPGQYLNDPSLYVDPLPHLLILTAIVVGVGVVGVALALLVRLYRTHGTLDEAVIADRLAGKAPAVRSADERRDAFGATARPEGVRSDEDAHGNIADGTGGADARDGDT